MTVEGAPIDSLKPDPRNPRTHPTKNLAAIKDSLQRFGQTKPIVVSRQSRQVIAGNGTLEAAKQLGWKDIQVVWTDLEGEEAVAAGIADNRSGELAEWNYRTLSGLLAELKTKDIKIDDLGFAAHELEPLLQADWKPKEPGDMPDAGSSGGSTIALTTEQKVVIERAVERVRAIHKDPDMKIGRALEIICTGYLGAP